MASERHAPRQRGVALSTLAIALSLVIMVMGMAYLGVAGDLARHAVVGEQRAKARAAAEGALTEALHVHAPSLSAGTSEERTIAVGGIPVRVRIGRPTADRARIRVEARAAWGQDEVTSILECEAALEAGGARAVRVRTVR